jgi:ferric-dicitrate binding protein FerR (iron transport regulator)
MNMSQEESHMDFNSLVTRKISGEMTPEEERRFQEELRRDPAKQALLDEYRKIWDSVGSVPEATSYDLDAEWALIQPKLPGYQSDQVRTQFGKSRRLLYYSYRIAAIFILGLVLSLSWFYLSRMAGMERVVARNEPVEVVLDDGTHLTVNRNSTIRYKKKFMAGERQVSLSGEAWFEVARDTTRPFVIDAGAALVEVLGTSFNVNAYKENPVVEITVKSGLVAMSAKEDQKDLIVMKAGSGGTYHKAQKELTLLTSSDPNNISWKTRELYFDGSSLREVAKLVNRVYGANLVIANPNLSSCEITVTFKDQSLEAILTVLEMTLDLDITQSGDEIRLDGKGCNE